jgi:Sulfotransferase family
MIISHKHKFIILAPWKTASSTMFVRFAEFNESPYDNFYHFNSILKRVVHRHITLADFLALPEAHLGYRIAAFVRNPYDRVYSGFMELQRALDAQPRMTYPQEWVRELVMRQLAENFEQLCQASFDFNRWVASLRAEQILQIGRNSSFPLHPACYWTHVSDKLYVDFLGRLEHFETDFESLTVSLGLSNLPMINGNVSDAPNDTNNGSPYRYLGFMSPNTIAKINELFDDDFRLLGYEKIIKETAVPQLSQTRLSDASVNSLSKFLRTLANGCRTSRF